MLLQVTSVLVLITLRLLLYSTYYGYRHGYMEYFTYKRLLLHVIARIVMNDHNQVYTRCYYMTHIDA